MRRPPLIALAATALITLAPVAHARPGSVEAWVLTPGRNNDIRKEISRLDKAIDTAAARRTISRSEARNLRNQSRYAQSIYAKYTHGGLSRAEVRDLQNRVNRIRVALRMERLDWDRRPG